MLADRPLGLGFPSDIAQSAYYPSNEWLTQEELATISKIMEDNSIYLENTRVHKHETDGRIVYDILQASTQDAEPIELQNSSYGKFRLVGGDHRKELQMICSHFYEARKYVSNPTQESILSLYQDSFTTGNIENYKESQRLWIKDLQPSVEAIFGFVEPYRDPMGIRAEFEGLVAITDKEETQTLTKLVDNSDKFIRRLPWALDTEENDGKGPFEKELFEKPDFTSLHSKHYRRTTDGG
jgi:dipeptidyl-peptidase III